MLPQFLKFVDLWIWSIVACSAPLLFFYFVLLSTVFGFAAISLHSCFQPHLMSEISELHPHNSPPNKLVCKPRNAPNFIWKVHPRLRSKKHTHWWSTIVSGHAFRSCKSTLLFTIYCCRGEGAARLGAAQHHRSLELPDSERLQRSKRWFTALLKGTAMLIT